jgi:hypothetical protein
MNKKREILLLAQKIDQHLRAVRQALRQPVEADSLKAVSLGRSVA